MKLQLTFMLLIFLGISLFFDPSSNSKDVEFEVPPGFVVEKLLDDERSGGPVAITFDSNGHLVVAKEFDYITRFIDADGERFPGITSHQH